MYRQWLFACVAVILGISGCSQSGHDLTDKTPYANRIGTEYEVATDDLYAYGIYGDWPRKIVTHVTLIPGVGFSGYEVAFRKPIQRGHIFRIVHAMRGPSLIPSGVYYVVMIEKADLPPGIPVRVPLGGGNEGVGADLNPAIYTRVVHEEPLSPRERDRASPPQPAAP
jgi:hypothetical protein